MQLNLLFSGTVVSNGGDRAIVECQAALLLEHFPGSRITLADSIPAVATQCLPEYLAVPTAYSEVKVSDGRPAVVALRTRVHAARVVVAARFWKRGGHMLRCLLPRQERELIERFASYDAVIYCGGTSLVESYDLTPKFFELRLAAALQLPIVMMTQSLGPFAQLSTVQQIRWLTGTADLVLLRDELSLNNLEAIGADTGAAHVLPDIVFSAVTAEAISSLQTRTLPPHPRVAVSVRDISNFDQHDVDGNEALVVAVAALVSMLVEKHDADVRFVSTCQGIPAYWRDDSLIAQRVVGALAQHVRDRVHVDASYHSTAELVDVFRSMDLVVATRLHAAILSLVAGVPAIPIAYESKSHTVYGGLGVGDWVTDARGIEPDTLIANVEGLLLRIDDARRGLGEALNRVAVEASSAGSLAAVALSARLGKDNPKTGRSTIVDMPTRLISRVRNARPAALLARRLWRRRGVDLAPGVYLPASVTIAAPGIRIGQRSRIGQHVFFRGPDIEIGERVFLNDGVYINHHVTIADNVSIGQYVRLITGNHEIGPPEHRADVTTTEPIVIGAGAWLAAGVTVLPGVTIGPGAVIAAGAVVNRAVGANELHGGIPAKLIRHL